MGELLNIKPINNSQGNQLPNLNNTSNSSNWNQQTNYQNESVNNVLSMEYKNSFEYKYGENNKKFDDGIYGSSFQFTDLQVYVFENTLEINKVIDEGIKDIESQIDTKTKELEKIKETDEYKDLTKSINNCTEKINHARRYGYSEDEKQRFIETRDKLIKERDALTKGLEEEIKLLEEDKKYLETSKVQIRNFYTEKYYDSLQNVEDFNQYTEPKITQEEADAIAMLTRCFAGPPAYGDGTYPDSKEFCTNYDKLMKIKENEQSEGSQRFDNVDWDLIESAYEKGFNMYEVSMLSMQEGGYLNKQLGVGSSYDESNLAGGSSELNFFAYRYSYMTPEEQKIANYIYNTEGKEEFEKYLDFKAAELNSREGLVNASIFLDDLQNSEKIFKDEVYVALRGLVDGTGNFFEGLDNVFNGIDGVASPKQYETMYILNWLTPEQIDELPGLTDEEKDKLKSLKGLSQTGSTNPLTGNTFLEDTYNVSSSIGNMLPAMAASTVVSIAFTPAAGQVVGSTLMGISAAGNNAEAAYQQGYGYWESIFYGTLTGASEACLGYFLGGIPGLSNTSSSFVVNMLKEGGEEALQTVLEPYLLYMATGTTPEINWEEVWQSGIYGIITAGIMSGGEIILPNNIVIDVDAISMDTIKATHAAEEVGIKIDYSKINDQNYIEEIKNKAYQEYVNICKKTGESDVVEKSVFLENYKTIPVIQMQKDINYIKNTSVQEYLADKQKTIETLNNICLNSTNSSEVVNLFKELNKTNPELCNELLLNTDSFYMQTLTQQLMEPTLDYYSEAVSFANSENASEFKTYRTHCETHVKEVAEMSLESALAISETLKAQGYRDVNLFEVYVAGLWHDVGMAAGAENVKGINSNYNKHTKEYNPEILKETKNGDVTRSNHTLNSALAILDNSSYFSETLGIDPNFMALSVFAHSKSNSGITNLTSESDWVRGINILNDCYDLYNKTYYPNENKSSFIDLCKNSGIITINQDGSFSLKDSALKKLQSTSLSLRIGDANTTTAGVDTIYNQANQEITYKKLEGSELSYDVFKEKFNNDTLSVHELICIEYGIDYKIEFDSKTNEPKVVALPSENEKVEIKVDGEKINVDQFNVGFIVGENNISFSSSNSSPTGKVDGKLHEVCKIKDSDIVMPTIFNINERLGEVKSGIPAGTKNQVASFDIVFPKNTSNDVISMYKEATRAYLYVDSIEYNFYIEDGQGNISKIK